uniref:Uncharacterized protein n=1 Tax=Anguilla anguilla TaxID=7936 RepID=A0A0E9VFC4_ANGAN
MCSNNKLIRAQWATECANSTEVCNIRKSLNSFKQLTYVIEPINYKLLSL